MKKLIFFIIGVILGAFVSVGFMYEPKEELTINCPEQPIEKEVQIIEVVTYKEVPQVIERIEVVEESPQEISTDELWMLAHCLEAEAGNQDLLGKRLVVDVILNRVDSDKFPNDIISVIAEDGQFSVFGSGAMYVVEPSESTLEAIEMELEHRTDSNIIYFRNGKAHSWCEQSYKHGDHYFGW